MSEILKVALRIGAIDIFKVIYWQVNDVPDDKIIEELTEILLRKKRELV